MTGPRLIPRLLLAAVLCWPRPAAPQGRPGGTRLLAEPALSASRIAFAYAGDLWTAALDGSDVRRLTSAVGDERSPVFSPDGSQVAFSANYDGNVDVYLIPTAGGEPKRLTWHPGDDLVQSFTPDGRAVLFTSDRASFTGRYTQLYLVPVAGGVEERLPIPNASRATFSPDGSRLAYNPLPPFAAYPQWKHYRGGAIARIWLYDRRSQQTELIPQPAGGANDTDPVWLGETIYFRSDRAGEFNLFGYDTKTKQVRQLTRSDDFPVLAVTGSWQTGQVAYESGGYLHLVDRAGADRTLAITVGAELRETRPRFVRGGRYIRNATLSPTGARAALEFRGEIVTVPAEKGDIRNLTNTVGAHERSPAWSPDGSKIAYLSDQSGEYQIVVASQDGQGDRKTYQPIGAGYYFDLDWSPDGKRLAYSDNSQGVYVLDLETGKAVRVGGNVSYAPSGLSDPSHAWSPDSKWLVYSANVQPMVERISLYSVERAESFPVTDDLATVAEPVFDPSGKYLYLLASTDAGPLADWFSQANAGVRRTRGVYAIVLRRDLPNPVAKQSDEEPGRPAPKSDSAKAATPPAGIDLDGLRGRVVALPIAPADLSNLTAIAEGTILYRREADGQGALRKYTLADRKDETILPNVTRYWVSGNAKKLLYAQGTELYLATLGAPIAPGAGRLGTDRIEVEIDPRAEWAQIYQEAWRINRDYFYDPNMHGADWPAVRAKYAALLPDLATRADLNRLLQWMGSELSVGHHYITAPGDRLETPARVSGGLLGADFDVANGRYRIARLLAGLNWTPTLRSPLSEPGVNARAGEYLLAVNGRDLAPPANLYSAFVNTADKLTELRLGPNSDGTGSRVVQVVPLADDRALRMFAWVEGNLRKVDSASQGKVAYVYVPNTADAGYTFFRRYFYPQAHKQAIIVDERYNGGGSAADYYIEALRREPLTWWTTRQGADMPNPAAAIAGPKALLINETAGSGGDYFPWMFKKYRLGTVIGKRTWGGLVGILGFPILLDGGAITAPDFAAWAPDSGWIVENVGVAPDIEVDQLPADVAAGRDPQLDRALEVVLGELRRKPVAVPKRPPFPVKARRR